MTQVPACRLLVSDIVHTRHGEPRHVLARKGLSLWIDLDRLKQADGQARLFSVDGFNLLSFRQRDHGPNFRARSGRNAASGSAGRAGETGRGHVGPAGDGVPVRLADHARRIARKARPEARIASVHLLAFPRVLGLVFNPVSIYVLRDRAGRDVFYIYEVRNTFGEMHSYVGAADGGGTILEADKAFHVSPFFDVAGGYRLMFRSCERTGEIRVLMRYAAGGGPRLTATMRGRCERLGDAAILRALAATCQWPLRPLASIHFEALRLWLKGARYFRRPEPPDGVSNARLAKAGSRQGRSNRSAGARHGGA